MRMHMLKQTLNFIVPRIHRLSSGTEAKTFQSKLILRVWSRLEDTLTREVQTGCFNDRNFRNLLRATRDGLIFLCEYDRYYKRWLGLLTMFLSEELKAMETEFTYEDALQLSARPLGLTREEFEKHKKDLYELAVCGYLYALSNFSEEDIKKIAEARQQNKPLEFPRAKAQPYFVMFFPERVDVNDKKKR